MCVFMYIGSSCSEAVSFSGQLRSIAPLFPHPCQIRSRLPQTTADLPTLGNDWTTFLWPSRIQK